MYTIHPLLELSFSKTAAIQALFAQGERVSAKVLQILPANRALIRIKGVDMEVSSHIPLHNQQRLTLKVVEVNERLIRFMLVEQAVKSAPVILSQIGEKGSLWSRVHKELFSPLIKHLRIIDPLDPKKLSAEELKESILRLHPKNEGLKDWLSSYVGETKALELAMLLELLWLSGSVSKSFMTVLPLDWEELEESTILVKRLKSKEAYYCRIQLRFSETERVLVTLVLHRAYLNLTLAIEEERLRGAVQERLGELQKCLSGGKVAVNIFVKEYNDFEERSHLVGENFVKRHA